MNAADFTKIARVLVGLSVLCGAAALADTSGTRASGKTPHEKSAGAPLTAEDRLAIMSLKAHYEQCLDGGDVDAYAASFTPDGIVEFPGGRIQGRDKIREWVAGLMKSGMIGATPAKVRHVINVPDISGGGGRASVRTYVTIYSLNSKGAVVVASVSSYDDTVVKMQGRWLFEKSVMKADLGAFAKPAD